jgi:hypothetical protein
MNVKLMIVSLRVPGCVHTNFNPSRMSCPIEVGFAFGGAALCGIA